MKKLFIVAITALGFTFAAQAQDAATSTNGGQTAQGKWLIEANTGFGGQGGTQAASTSFGLTSVDGETAWSLGAEGGYFVADDLAVKVGLGYQDLGDDESAFSYKVGAKYYIASMIPVQVDYTGTSIKDADENPSFLGLQGGYAIFLGENVSIEPGLRYNIALNDDSFFNEDVFQLNIGFALHF
ncbi:MULTISPECIES: hypothetical protein [Cellulophaga]|uniref:Outer membrane protein beta-barrel domain-containing protein n=1 Tax=Cellulophaga geojensis KL-A TaxID=1328323 RepID=A0ABN0RQM6_9FLAO|nr:MULTISPECIES: hypothetical protein [Cellulophaga]AIM59111.1 hypothetical protein IX49_00660 [Cellulophaga lytica]APU08916.1 hypothetical protein A5M85_01010 [Cellulophaga lytica]EWH14189.1 hypothetical protein KLA_05947 [Cellulophaga geojensis KL-A]MDO6854278.1 hypothetical protein [Cellulophaga lytica]SNQ41960.1 conserved exported hypothetical protein [Cellulophaga lytica]